MEREWLKEQLEGGRSYEAIGREVGRHASTVARWARIYGLTSSHAARHANRGRIPRDTLAALVDQGLTVREIAEALARSPTSVRHWLRQHGLETRATRARRDTRVARAEGRREAERRCRKHGLTRFVLRVDGFRGARCAQERVAARRRQVKRLLVEEAGGACALCGYDRCIGVLHFHHVNPATKRFAVSRNGVTIALDRAREEARKCILLCANCHGEVENGVADLSPIIASRAVYAEGAGISRG